MNDPPVRLDRQGASVTAMNMVRLSAAAIRIAESPIGVSFSDGPWTRLLGRCIGVCKSSFDANLTDFHEKTVSVNGWNLTQCLADAFSDVKALVFCFDAFS